MIQKLPNGKYRVRYDYGHERRYNSLCRRENLTPKQVAEKERLEKEWGLPQEITTRRSMNCLHYWEAVEIEEAFKAAAELEALGKKVPSKLLQIELAPHRDAYRDELAFAYASICGFKKEHVGKLEWDMFLAQADADRNWIKHMEISKDEVCAFAEFNCECINELDLSNKTILFTGAVTGFTGSAKYLKALKTLAQDLKVDAIVTAGEWIKTIFLHKTSTTPYILPELEELAKSVKIIAIRSNRDKPRLLNRIKDLGIIFVNGIVDDRNVFSGIRLHGSSAQDQLKRFEESYPGKNVFVHTTYVGLRTQATKGGDLRYLVGSGSSGHNTPRARFWANAYDSQLLNSEIRDSIGGHVLRFDSERNVYPTTFRYHEDLEAILYGGKAYFGNRIEPGDLVAILSDFHATSHHKAAFYSFLEFLEEHQEQINTLVINGDFFTNEVLCHWNSGDLHEQIKIAMRDMDFLKEVAYTRECLKLIVSKVKPGTKLIFKLGNHEKSSFDKFLKRDINHFLASMLELDKLLELTKLGFEVIPADKAYEVGEIMFTHGHEMHRKQARKIFGKGHTRGHSHGCEIDPLGMTLSGMEDPDRADYLWHPYTKWSVGFGSMTIYKDYSVMPQPHLTTKDKYANFYEIRDINSEVEVSLPQKITLEYDLEWTGREKL